MDRKSFEPSPLAAADAVGDVSDAQTGTDRWTLVFVRDLRHPPEKVWAALTEPAQLSEWAPFTTDRGLGQVGEATLTMIDGDTKLDLPAVVRTVERPSVLEYTWGEDLLRWELAPIETGTRLTLRHTVEERDLLPKVAAGWHLCLDVAERLLDGEPIGPIRGSDAMNFGWDDLRAGYAAKMGLPATE
jgi:uncharacterized protein YndB with AHSA1/START domain